MSVFENYYIRLVYKCFEYFNVLKYLNNEEGLRLYIGINEKIVLDFLEYGRKQWKAFSSYSLRNI